MTAWNRKELLFLLLFPPSDKKREAIFKNGARISACFSSPSNFFFFLTQITNIVYCCLVYYRIHKIRFMITSVLIWRTTISITYPRARLHTTQPWNTSSLFTRTDLGNRATQMLRFGVKSLIYLCGHLCAVKAVVSFKCDVFFRKGNATGYDSERHTTYAVPLADRVAVVASRPNFNICRVVFWTDGIYC